AIRGGCRPSTRCPRQNCPSPPGSGWRFCVSTSSSREGSCSSASSRWRSGPTEALTQSIRLSRSAGLVLRLGPRLLSASLLSGEVFPLKGAPFSVDTVTPKQDARIVAPILWSSSSGILGRRQRNARWPALRGLVLRRPLRALLEACGREGGRLRKPRRARSSLQRLGGNDAGRDRDGRR